MKIDPLNILINEKFKFDKKLYLISGNEISLINEIKYRIINDYKQRQFVYQRVNNFAEIITGGELFGDKKIYYIDGGIDKNTNLEDFFESEDFYIVILENSPKIRSIKENLSKNKNCCVIDCYELDSENKKKVVNFLLGKAGIKLNNNNYWVLIDRLDSRYGFLMREIENIIGLGKKDIEEIDLLQNLHNKSNAIEKVFFELLSSNKNLINIYRNKVLNDGDVSIFFNYIKQFCYLIINNENKINFSKSVPKYLFKEKNRFISIFEKFNNKKKGKLIQLIYRTESLIRKERGLSVVIGLKFLLSLRKITIS
ncbi:hypothetical protein OAY11_01285 [Pelagibacteraceae bacterium]|nr:hypothetical protein [Pelagibacteraceae bacterium]